MDLFDTSPYPFRSSHSTPSKTIGDTNGSPYIPLYIRCASQRPPLHMGLSSDALKIRKCRKSPNYNLALVNFDSIDVCEVNYLPSFVDGDVIVALPPLPCGIHATYRCGMDGMDKIYDGHV